MGGLGLLLFRLLARNALWAEPLQLLAQHGLQVLLPLVEVLVFEPADFARDEHLMGCSNVLKKWKFGIILICK